MVKTSLYEYLRIDLKEAKEKYAREKEAVLKDLQKRFPEVRDMDVVLLKESPCRWIGGVLVKTNATFFYPVAEEGEVQEIPEEWTLVVDNDAKAPVPYQEAEKVYYSCSVAKVVEV